MKNSKAVQNMCGKFSQSMTWRQLVDASQPLIPRPEEACAVVTPMTPAYVVGVGGDGVAVAFGVVVGVVALASFGGGH